MSHSYPGDKLSVEQLVYALTHALDPNSPSGRRFFISGPQKTSAIEHDLSDILRTTREILNTSAPINKLPPEILSLILQHRTHERTLLAATHVCQSWRSALTSNPSLWTCFLFVTHPDADRTLTYLERSKSAPIYVTININPPATDEALRYLAPHISRMRSCLINGTDKDAHAFFSHFGNPSPLLRHLEIRTSEYPPTLPDSSSGLPLSPESPFPNLTEFTLSRQGGAGSFRLNTVFQILSCSPQLRRIRISTYGMLQETPPDQIITLESLEELDYTCRPADRILPWLRLPRLKLLRVDCSYDLPQEHDLVDILPHGGHLLLVGVTKMEYFSDWYSHKVALSGTEIDVSLSVSCSATGPDALLHWVLDETYIPLGQIKELALEGWSVISKLPFNPFRSLEVLRVHSRDTPTDAFCRTLYPGAELACTSLREIRYDCRGSLPALVNLAKERKKAGHQLGLVWLLAEREPDQGRVEELREYVGEVRVEIPERSTSIPNESP